MEFIIGRGPAMVVHDQHIVNSESRLAAELGVTSWLSLGLVVPLRVFHTTIRYLDANGREVAIDNPFVHHHNETLTGLGDPLVLGRAARSLGGFMVGVRAGVSVPLGRTEPDPFELGDLGLPHEHSQFGTGTFAPILGLDAARLIHGVRLDAFALSIQSLYANSHGYRAGDRYAGGVGAASALGTKRFRFRATVEGQHETAETWHGIVHTDEGNTGRTDILAGVEATWRMTDDWHLGLSAKLPVYTHVQGGQVDTSVFVGLSLGTHVHLFGEGEDEHRHYDRAELAPGDWTGLDMQEISTDGSAPPLAPVPGKITVFDLWAEWCEPCHVLDHELAQLVRRHPDDVAVRKINIIDNDSAAATTYLGARTLPHVKVFGKDGKLLWEHSAAPLVLSSEIEQLVSGPAPTAVVIPSARRIAITVTDHGFSPAHIEIPVATPVTLVFTRASEATCAVDVHLAMPDGTRRDADLPLGQPVEVPVLLPQPGVISFACGMDMDRGTIEAK